MSTELEPRALTLKDAAAGLTRVAVTCRTCGAEFLVHPYRREAARYCSIKCRNAAATGPNHPSWRGGRHKTTDGYTAVLLPGHPNEQHTGLVLEHIAIAERALGRKIPDYAVVHHVNGQKRDNRNSNLVICQDSSYHSLIHRRARVVAAGGNPNTQKICSACGGVKDFGCFYRHRSTGDRRQSSCIECSKKGRVS